MVTTFVKAKPRVTDVNGRQEVEQSNKMATGKTMGQQGGREKASDKY